MVSNISMFKNKNIEVFNYNLLYKNWCLNQLILSYDHIDDIIIIMKKKLNEILRIRNLSPPSVDELTKGLYYDNFHHHYKYVFINSDGIVFISHGYNMSNIGSKRITLQDMKAQLMKFSNCEVRTYSYNDLIDIEYSYESTLNTIYKFNMFINSSNLDFDDIRINGEKLQRGSWATYENPEIMSYS